MALGQDLQDDTEKNSTRRAPPAQALRQVVMEFEPIDGVSQYEIEIKNEVTGRATHFKMAEPLWQAGVRPGKYELRIRSYDRRGVPGAWSEPMDFVVKFLPPNPISPKPNERIRTGESRHFETTFKWQPVPGAQDYKVEVVTSDGKVQSQTFSGTEGKIRLPVTQSYQWSVTAVLPTGEEGEKSEEKIPFVLLGEKLPPPDINSPSDRFVSELSWRPVRNAETYSYALARLEEGNWVPMDRKPNVTDTNIEFPLDFPGGKYRLQVRSESPVRENSELAQIDFDVFHGDRSPAAVEEQRLRESLDKPTRWYGIASYLISGLNYEGENPEARSRVTFPESIGGTGRLGLGYFNPDSTRGYFGIVDLTGFDARGVGNVTYASAEAHVVWRRHIGVGMIRWSTGLFYKEVIELKDRVTNPGQFEVGKVTAVGPHLGLEYWRPFTSKLGMQFMFRIYPGLVGLSTPNGEKYESRTSAQLGILGSYRLTNNVMGFMGLTSKSDEAAYASTPQDPANPAQSLAAPGDTQEIIVRGTYLNFILEWSF